MSSPSDLLPENNAMNAPREIMRLVNWMMSCNDHSVCPSWDSEHRGTVDIIQKEMFVSVPDANISQIIREVRTSHSFEALG
jgi:hypothetical protein